MSFVRLGGRSKCLGSRAYAGGFAFRKVAGLLAWLWWASPVSAQLAAPTVPSAVVSEAGGAPRNHLRADFGLTPGLFAGLAYGYSVHPWVPLELGVGFGDTGFQLSFNPAVSIPVGERSRLLVGVPVTLGMGREYTADASRNYGPGRFLWLGGLLGYQYRAQSGFTLLLAAGFITLVYGGEGGVECSSGDPGTPLNCRPNNQNLRSFGFGRIGFGYSF